MVRLLAVLTCELLLTSGDLKKAEAGNALNELRYMPDGQMKFPEHYREWIYLTSGLGMSYTPGAAADHPMFDNMFVNPTAYKAFLSTGTWPDQTVMVLELRGSETKASIDQRGSSQSAGVMGVEGAPGLL